VLHIFGRAIFGRGWAVALLGLIALLSGGDASASKARSADAATPPAAASFTVTSTVNLILTIPGPTISAQNGGANFQSICFPSGEECGQTGSTLNGGSVTVICNYEGLASIQYTPPPNFAGNDSFQYELVFEFDNNVSGTVNFQAAAIVDSGPGTITVAIPPSAGPLTATVAENQSTSINIRPAVTGSFTSDAIASNPAHGTATQGAVGIITYTPAANFVGSDSFAYEVTGAGGSSAAIVSIQVTPVAPVAVNQSATTLVGQAVTINAANGATGAPFTATAIATQPRNGTTSITGTNITYTPNAGFSGSDSFTFTLTNSVGTSAPATATIQVNQPVQLPVAANQPVSTPSGQAVVIDLRTNATGAPFTAATIATQPHNGTVSLVKGFFATYTPNAGFSGSDSFTFTLSNAAGTSQPATVTITVNPPPPVAANQSVSAVAGRAVTINATTGASGAPFTGAKIVTQPRNGTTSVAGTTITYTANSGFSGSDSLTFTLSNATGASAPATVAIQVEPVPLPKAVAISTAANTAITIDPTQGASGGPFTAVAIVTPPPANAGTATVTGLKILFTPNPAFAGVTSFAFTLSNAFATSAPAQISVTVAARPNPALDPNVVGMVNAQLDTSRRFYTTQLANFERRLDQLRAGHHGVSFDVGATTAGGSSGSGGTLSDGTPSGAASSGGTSSGGGVSGGAPSGGASSAGTSSAPGATVDPKRGGGASADKQEIELPDRLGIFVNGNVNVGSRNGTSNAAGFGFNTDGLSLGADYRLSDRLVLGIGGGYASGSDTIGSNGTRSNAQSVNGTLYGTFDPTDQLYIDGILTYGSLDFDSRRFITGSDGFAIGHRGGNQLYGALTAGYELHDGSLSIAPNARLELSNSQFNRFTETGGGALTFNAQSLDTTTGILGVHGDYAWSLADAILSPHFRLEYDHEFSGANRTSVLFADQPANTAFGLQPDPVVHDFATAAVGADYLLEDGLSFFVDAEALIGFTNEQSYTISFGISKRF
jgi:large repetitive protein